MASIPDMTTIRRALDLAIHAPSIHNSQPWRWRWQEPVLHLYSDETRWLRETDPEQTDLMVSCGVVLHHARVALASLGWAVTVDRSPDPAQPNHLAALHFTADAPEPKLAARAAAIIERRSNRAAYTSWEVPSGIIDLLTGVGAEEGVMVVHVHGAQAHRGLVDAMAASESVRASDVRYQAETAAWTGFAAAAGVGVPTRNLQAATYELNRSPFVREHGTQLIDSGEDDASALFVIGTWHDDAPSRVRAGEAMSAVLLEATAIGLATCPLSLPVEVPGTRDSLRAGVFFGRAYPQVIVRAGWAHVSQESLPPTPRLPLDAVFEVE
ncbi:MAG: hypothetical protein BGO26_05970 [Actinobacteria bacterium 69-20]|nr:NAD(P)H nitroreductase [Actinomycetota bacterium]OJV28013.1 MAG: hypothetical protein BGO26_05970 [Actinobacteria bacterium 69-20]